MLHLKTNDFLYRTRVFFAAASLLFVLYSAVFLWFQVPFGSPVFRWRADSRPVIADVPNEISTLLFPGDIIQAIGGQPVVRGRPIYPLPLAAVYDFTILRGEEVLTITVPVYAPLNITVVSMLLPSTILSLAGWFVGAIMLFWARRDNHQAIHAGYVFLLAGVTLIGVQASLDGVPGAWVAHSLIFPLIVGWIYLGTIPRSGSLSTRIRRLFSVLLFVTCSMAGAMLYEAIFLFPRFTSIQNMTGIGLYELGFFLSSLALLACVFVLLWRAWRLPHDSYIRQQLVILLVFFAIGVFPAVLLTIIPRSLFDVVLLPFPAAITLMMFIPAGYLFVIYRRGLLGLDPFFSRTIYLVLLSLVVFGFYASGLYLVQRWLRLEGRDAVAPATIIFFPTLLLTLYISKPVNEFVQWLVYGNERLYEDALARIMQALSTRPEMITLEGVVDMLTKMMGIPQAILMIRNEKGSPFLVRAVGVEANVPEIDELMTQTTQPILRSAVQSTKGIQQLFCDFKWAEILIPVMVRGEQVGLLALASPGEDGYFNTRQVSFLTQVAAILAVGSDNVALFETARFLSRQALAVREQERKQLAGRIHDESVQNISHAGYALEQIAIDSCVEASGATALRITAIAEQLHRVVGTLRLICQGLYPPFWDQGVEFAVRDIVNQFRLQNKLDVTLNVANEALGRVADATTESTCHILTECLNNIVKHGGGTGAQVKLQRTKRQITLTVTDTGPGSDIVHLSYSDLLRRHHLGIIGMHEWAKLVGGTLCIDVNEPTGIKVMFTCSSP